MMSGSFKYVVASTIALARTSGSPGLEDARTHEHAIGAEVHHHRCVGRRREATQR